MKRTNQKLRESNRKGLDELDLEEELGFDPLDLELDLDLSRQQLACDLPRCRRMPSLKNYYKTYQKRRLLRKTRLLKCQVDLVLGP